MEVRLATHRREGDHNAGDKERWMIIKACHKEKERWSVTQGKGRYIREISKGEGKTLKREIITLGGKEGWKKIKAARNEEPKRRRGGEGAVMED